jgi:hypothetical protein
MADRCSFCGSTAGPFSNVEGLFTVLMCTDCQAARGRGTGPLSSDDPGGDARRPTPLMFWRSRSVAERFSACWRRATLTGLCRTNRG